MEIDAYGVTDVGCVRDINEDALLVRKDLGLFVVADGVGGAAAGEVASALFVACCEEEFQSYTGWNRDYSVAISRCFHNANTTIRNHAREHPETRGMGCTAEVLSIDDGSYALGHVGDSRSYLIRNGEMERLTKDHSFVQEQIDLGLVSQDEAGAHWLRNAIYRAVGQHDDIEVDLISGRLRPGDRLLLCSDGLTDMVGEKEILGIIEADAPLAQRVDQLVAAARGHGGRDNITALLCEATREPFGQRLTSLFAK